VVPSCFHHHFDIVSGLVFKKVLVVEEEVVIRNQGSQEYWANCWK